MIDTYNLLGKTSSNPNNQMKADDPALQEFLTFNDRDTYLAWRQEWREHYRTLSQRIRELRTAWRAEGNNHAFQLHNDLFRSRDLARSLLALRAASKVRAEALYQASKATAEVA